MIRTSRGIQNSHYLFVYLFVYFSAAKRLKVATSACDMSRAWGKRFLIRILRDSAISMHIIAVNVSNRV